jgi:hypothetical protein
MTSLLHFYEEPEFLTSATDLVLNKKVRLAYFNEDSIKNGVRINNIQTLGNNYTSCTLKFYKNGTPVDEIPFSYNGQWAASSVLLPNDLNRQYIKDPQNIEVELSGINVPLAQPIHARLIVEDMQRKKAWPKIATWQAECRECKSPVYYYPAKLLLESRTFQEPPEDLTPKLVVCSCTGEKGGVKHTLKYSFPSEFKKQ